MAVIFILKSQNGYKTFSPTDRGGVFTGYVYQSRRTLGNKINITKQNYLTTYNHKQKKNNNMYISIKKNNKYICGSKIILLKSPGDDDTSSGGHVRQPISGLGCGRGYLAAIGLDRAV